MQRNYLAKLFGCSVALPLFLNAAINTQLGGLAKVSFASISLYLLIKLKKSFSKCEEVFESRGELRVKKECRLFDIYCK